MVLFLSLLTAGMFGAGDFFGGLAAKRVAVVQVVAGSHLVGLIGALAASVLVAGPPAASDLLLGSAAGSFGALGVGLLYRGLARGPMSIVAPLTAITAAAVPAGWGLATGDSVGVWAGLGLVLALVAIGLVSRANDSSAASVTVAVVGEALLAGLGFGAFFILIDATNDASAPWPVVGARLTSSVVLLVYLISRKRPATEGLRGARWLILATGVLDTGSNVLFLYAVNAGQLTLVSVLSSLYPVSTVLLARFALGEKVAGTQRIGMGLALVATVLIAMG